MQHLIAEAGEVEIEQLPLPITRLALDGKATVGKQVVAQRQWLSMRFLLFEHMAQRPGHLQYRTVIVEMNVQAQHRRDQRLQWFVSDDR